MSKHSHKLNVLQLMCPTGFYGAERWVLALARHIDPRAVRLDLATTREGSAATAEISDRFAAEHGNLGAAIELPMSHRFDIGVIGRLVAVIRDREIDIIHSHGYKSDILGVVAARRAGIRCVMTPHGFEKTRDLKLKLFVGLGRLAMKYADAVTPLSRQIYDIVRKQGIDDEHNHYIQNGLDLSEIETVSRSARKDGESRRIGYVGQLNRRKNVIDILDVFDRLNRRHPDLELVLVGDGDQRAELERQARQLPSGARIRFTGFRDDRLDLLQSFDLFIMTSAQEGIPRCLMEAMATGVPVAAYRIPGVDQLIDHEQTGLSATFGDTGALAEQCDRLLTDEDLARSLSHNARALIRADFSAQRMADEYLDLYRSLARAQIPVNARRVS